MGADQPGGPDRVGSRSVLTGPTLRVVRVLPDVGAINREFDYLVPDRMADSVGVGTMVRVPLHGRRVAGWVTAVDVEPPAGLRLAELTKVSGRGPSPDIIELCRWAAWRWAGPVATFLGAASPPTMVTSHPRPRRAAPIAAPTQPEVTDAWSRARTVLRLPPAADVVPVILGGAALGDTLVVCPSHSQAGALGRALRAHGVGVASHPADWALGAAGGCSVVGTRTAAFAPMPNLAAVVVVDEHDEALQNEGSPTWHAREVVLERARRARVPAVMVSPCPSLESVARSPLRTVARAGERSGWPVVEVVDRRSEDTGRTGLYSEALVRALRTGGRRVCVLNRRGRAGLLACTRCGTTASCERCAASVTLPEPGRLTCRSCATERPVVCQSCGATTLRYLRVGIGRAREELEALMREPVVELTGDSVEVPRGPEALVIGTEAALHRVGPSSVVAFLEFDQELLAPRYRAAEQAMALLARAGRLLGGRDGGGRLVVQTRDPDHPVIRAAVHADPGIVMEREAILRELTRFPPAVTIALIGGEAAGEFVERLGAPLGVEVMDRGDGQWLAVAEDRPTLLDALRAVDRPSGRLRLQIDPMRFR